MAVDVCTGMKLRMRWLLQAEDVALLVAVNGIYEYLIINVAKICVIVIRNVPEWCVGGRATRINNKRGKL